MAPGNDSENMDLLHHELITEILSWLPVESLLRFKTVCKLWRDTIQQQNFTHLHMRRCSLLHPGVLPEIYSDGTTGSFTNVSSCNGIMLERCSSTNKYRIRNPRTKHLLHLPSPKRTEPAVMLVRFIVKTKEYKLVSYHSDKTTKRSGFEVLTIGTDSSWRPLDDPTNFHYAKDANVKALCMDDVVYIFGRSMDGDPGVICLDAATEQSKEVALPSCLLPDRENFSVSKWNGKFSVTSIVKEQIHAWVLEDYKKCKWIEEKIVIPQTLFILKDHPHFSDYRVVYVGGTKLAFSDKGRNTLIGCDTKSGEAASRVFASPSGNKYWVSYRPSLEHFRGMQPEY